MFECCNLYQGGGFIKAITLRLDDALHKQLKLMTVQEEVTIQDYLSDILPPPKRWGLLGTYQLTPV